MKYIIFDMPVNTEEDIDMADCHGTAETIYDARIIKERSDGYIYRVVDEIIQIGSELI